jgi:hypothetical protein
VWPESISGTTPESGCAIAGSRTKAMSTGLPVR